MISGTAPMALMLRPLGLGDFLTGLPAYRAVARAFPNHRIVLAAPRSLAALAGLTGCLHDVADSQPLRALAAHLHGADVAIDLHGRGPESHRVLLASRPRRLVAFRNEEIPQSAHGAVWRADEHEVERWCRMLSHAGIPAEPSELDLAVPPVLVPRRIRGATLIHPGAASESRRWPVDRWAAVAAAEQRAGRRVIITGGGDDVERARAIASAAQVSPTHVFAGRTTLRELAALTAAAGRVVCGDTGVAHLATAFRTPSVVLFGPIPPAWWGPPRERTYHRVLWAGRRGDPHAAEVDPGLLDITPEAVIAELRGLAERTEHVA
ncbi:MAG: glycosyltransferase family 9 protein [Candidatus Velthaea sp.]